MWHRTADTLNNTFLSFFNLSTKLRAERMSLRPAVTLSSPHHNLVPPLSPKTPVGMPPPPRSPAGPQPVRRSLLPSPSQCLAMLPGCVSVLQGWAAEQPAALPGLPGTRVSGRLRFSAGVGEMPGKPQAAYNGSELCGTLPHLIEEPGCRSRLQGHSARTQLHSALVEHQGSVRTSGVLLSS